MLEGGSSERDLASFLLPEVGQLVETGSPWAPYRMLDSGIEFSFDATLLLEIENSKARSAEVVSLGPLTTLAITDGLDDRNGPWAAATWLAPFRDVASGH
ncbi:hypothetical protein ACFYXH_41975 [Streptomyces sp. NPDC002730]|uniref:hypothetical protein n=1 Tax=Streptomyces sp. NPDC002730 TaxID=3364662 RepID=UPI003693455B